MNYSASAIVLFGCLLSSEIPATEIANRPANELIWVQSESMKSDTYAAFRGWFDLGQEAEIELRSLGSSWYVIWLDGRYVEEGPARFPIAHPEYQARRIRLAVGRHLLAVQVHHIGETTRMLIDMPPFLHCRVVRDGQTVPVEWRCSQLAGYKSQVRRVNPQLGWIEWCDTRQIPKDWQSPEFDDRSWIKPVAAEPRIGVIRPANLAPVRQLTQLLKPMADGLLAEVFGYEFDDIPARFFLRDLACDKRPAQGVWRRYDLGRVRLGRPRLVLDLPAGAVVEFAYCEALMTGRVSPYIPLSAGASCNLDHYVARGGPQEFFPLTPKGGRFVEVHVLGEPARVRFIKEEYVERCYFGPAESSFTSGDALLDRIWLTGVETHRACCEDALTDNPTRERGQWTGDVVSVGMDIQAVAFSDLRLCRRGLVQSAYCAREDGLVAGLSPGGPAYLSTYAMQWIDACVHYHELTGDRTILEELYPHAVRNLGAFEALLSQDGLKDGAGWAFVDWGYVRNEGPVDIACNLHYLSAIRTFIRWCKIIEREAEISKYEKLAKQIETVVSIYLRNKLVGGEAGWRELGYHTAVLALRLKLIEPQRESECLRYIKSHILSCFPNNPTAPRLSAPDANHRQLITPYFAHYAFPGLIERGEMDWVLDQYRKCWGWALEDGRTTWVEVFDTRWTHCHQWAGCPTWQLSRYLLGLHSRFDIERNRFELKLRPGSLTHASGKLPLPDGKGVVSIDWRRGAKGIAYHVVTDAPISIDLPAVSSGETPRTIRIDPEVEIVLP